MTVSVVSLAPHLVAAVLPPLMTTHHLVVAAALRIHTVVATIHPLIHMSMADPLMTDLLQETTLQESLDTPIMTAVAATSNCSSQDSSSSTYINRLHSQILHNTFSLISGFGDIMTGETISMWI
jgi:hypothetical protein